MWAWVGPTGLQVRAEESLGKAGLGTDEGPAGRPLQVL